MTGPDLRATHAQRTRAAIRAAALTLTRERGYAAMTVDDVAALAGVSRRTVFNHFSSKADLLVLGPEAPEPQALEAFVNGTGTLLEDLGALLASGAEAVESERGWLLSFPEIVRDNPEVERAIHERLRTVALSLIDAAGRRLGTTPDDPRTRAVVALAMGIQRSSVDLWSGRTHPWEQDGPEPSADAEVPTVRNECPEVRLADAIHVMTRAIVDVVVQPRSAEAVSCASAGLTPSHSPD
ncbi:helix-turn-helix domain-containing protein [uncultured Actinomyces sp.]|uniref:TetR/AcrR family transcriptional regulator n=1 Tax=uncultured Actinomyces sp. TaxID=249061 RepID=UPI0028D33093|nr:helix-turn-helix domain-containing protein [uncultured Actinomyces sp.]